MKHQTLTRPALRSARSGEADGRRDSPSGKARSRKDAPGGGSGSGGLFSFRRGASKKALAEATRGLAALVGARMPLVRALRAAAEQSSGRAVAAAFKEVCREVEAGRSLSESLAGQPEVFSPLYVHLTRVGEATGGLAGILRRLAGYLERAYAVQRKVRLAMIYPGLIAAVAVGAVSFMLTVIVPTFADMFEDFGAELPVATQYLLWASETLVSNAFWILLGGLGIWLAARAALRSAPGRWWWDGARLRLPVLGGIEQKSLAARFGRTLGTLLEQGVTLTEALELLSASAENTRARQQIESMQEAVERGEALSEELGGAGSGGGSGSVFPPLMSQMVVVGEETARLDEMLLHVATLYEEELDETVDTLTSVIEPALILVIGALLGGILIALYLPMFDLVTAVQ